MTTVGGLGHALPYLIPHFWTATAIAMVIVVVELFAITWIQNRTWKRRGAGQCSRWCWAALWCLQPAC